MIKSVLSKLAQEAFDARQGVECSPEEWMALFLADYSELVIHEAASVANAVVDDAGGNGKDVFEKIKKHFEVIEDEQTEQGSVPEN